MAASPPFTSCLPNGWSVPSRAARFTVDLDVQKSDARESFELLAVVGLVAVCG